MSDVHRIRLRGPWETLPLPDAGTCYVRRFGNPRRQDAREQIYLVIDPVVQQGCVRLNGHALGAIEGAFRVNITDLLQARNCLEIDVTHAEASGNLTEAVALEIG